MGRKLRNRTARSQFALGASAVALIAALTGCGDDKTDKTSGGDQTGTTPDPELGNYLKDTWGITTSGFKQTEFEVLDDGTQMLDDVGTITVEGLGSQQVSTTTLVEPAATGGMVSFFVSNTDLSDERYFLYDPVENYVTIGDLTRGVAVSKNPDDTYDVWAFDGDDMDKFVTVDNGFEALRMVEEYNGFKALSPHIMLMAFAAAHTTVPEARVPIHCTDTAATPPVCEIFKEFCDCAACLVLEREGACDLCPDL